jgi:hypothetical protein
MARTSTRAIRGPMTRPATPPTTKNTEVPRLAGPVSNPFSRVRASRYTDRP